MRLVKHLAPASRNTHTSFENVMQKIEKIFDGGEFPHVEEDGVEEFRMNMKAHAEKAYDSGYEFAALALATGHLQALKPLKRDDEQPGDSEDGNEVHLVDPPSKKFKERHERFQKSKKPTPEAALIPNLLKQIMEMQGNLSLNQRTLMDTVGNLAQQVYDLKALTEDKRASSVSSAPGQSAESAIKVEGLEVPPKILRNFQAGVKRKVIKDPTIQCTGQNKKGNFVTFCIAKKPILDGSTGARKILQDIMPIEQATRCQTTFRPKLGWAGHTNFVTNTERCNLHKIVKKVSLNVLTGDTALMKFSKEDESEAAMLQGNVSELLILALHVLNGFSPDGSQVEVSEVEGLSLQDALTYLRESNVPITFEFLVYCSAVALFPHVNLLHGQGFEKFTLSNPLQGILYHFLLVEVFCKLLDMGLVDEFLNLAPPDSEGFYVQMKTASIRKTEELEKYCNDHDIEVPDLNEFYFKKPSDFEEAFLLPADHALLELLKKAEEEDNGGDEDE